MRFAFAALLVLIGQDSLPKPEEYFGFRPGADRKLFGYQRLYDYFELLAGKSPHLKLFPMGPSTLGNPLVLAAFSTPENLKSLDRYREIAQRLAHPENLSEDDARKLAAEAKVILLVTLNIHSTEIGSSQMAAELAHLLARGHEHLKDVILLLIPSLNPDGQIMVTDYYNKHVGTEFEGGPLPWLYHPYCGHDNNRDWYAFNLEETRLTSQVYYRDWLPQVIVDIHQMGQTGPRFFVPPYKDPPNPNVHPLIWRHMAAFGTNIALACEERGQTGVVHGELFTGWWPGTSIMTPWWHNQIGILFELASCRIATPIYIEPNEVDVRLRMNNSSPWKGGWWRLREIVDYELTGTMSVLETCAKNKERILLDQYRMAQDAIQKGKTEPPYGYVIPSDGHDPAAIGRLVEILRLGGVRVRRAAKGFLADSTAFPAGSYVISTAQAYRPYILDLFQEQRYPDLRRSPKEEIDKPYDAAGWTLPYQMGVQAHELKAPIPGDIEYGEDAGGPLPSGGVVEVHPGSTHGALLMNRLLADGVEVFRERETGAIYFKPSAGAMDGLSLRWTQLDRMPEMDLVKARRPRVALLKPWSASMDEGWTRLLLERFEFDFKNLAPEEVRKEEWLRQFDALILPSLPADALVDGPDPKPPFRYPPEFRHGLGKEGVETIEKFVKQGGTLVTLAQASHFALDRFNLPASNALKEATPEQFYCPGSILRLRVDPSHPIGYGMPAEIPAVFTGSSLAFDTKIPFGAQTRRVVAWFADRDVLMSGWLTGEERLARKPAVVEIGWEKGRIVMFGFPPQFRAQPWGTFKLFFNALFSSAR
jgi:hypothetical protein